MKTGKEITNKNRKIRKQKQQKKKGTNEKRRNEVKAERKEKHEQT